jgi:phospholipid/cholesterol/gamma-HCH transport system substrate-binding protein
VIRVPSPILRWAAGVGVACAVLVALLLGPVTSAEHSGAQAGATYRVDVIFDTAKGIIPGQLVKIAGARVGEIKDVVLTPDFKARIQMEVDRRFAPFRRDARCEIQPEGLISERFVQCEPGTPDAGALEPAGGQAATVPVTNTSVPVAITDLFNIFRVPVRQRLSVVITSLGIGLAGRGEDVNDVLRRANPTLALTRKALNILGDQRRALRDSVIAVDKVAADLARRPGSVTAFLDEAAKVSTTTAEHRGALEQAIKRLPGLLDEVQPTLSRLNGVAADGTPVLRDLRAATPALNSLVDQVGPFSAAAQPALARLGVASDTGRKTIKAARPVVRLLKSFAASAGPTGTSLNALLVNLQERGGIENLLKFIYGGAAASSRYDAVSHILPAHIFSGDCGFYSETPVAGCSANFGAQPAAARAKRASAGKRTPAAGKDAATGTPAPAAPAAPAAPGGADGATTPGGPSIRLPGLPPIQLPPVPGALGATGKSGDANVADLLRYLLGS